MHQGINTDHITDLSMRFTCMDSLCFWGGWGEPHLQEERTILLAFITSEELHISAYAM